MPYLSEDGVFEFEVGRIARIRRPPPRVGDLSAFRNDEFEEEIIGGPDDRVLIKDTIPVPHRFICRLMVHMREKNNRKAKPALWIGTGILIGNRHVLTAGHNIARVENGIALEMEAIKLAPGYNGALANPMNWTPLGSATVKRSDCKTNYDAGGFKDQDDYALIVLKEDLGLKKFPALKGQPLGYWGHRTYGGLTVVRPTTAEEMQGQAVQLCGYQSDKCGANPINTVTDCGESMRGSTQWSAGGTITGCANASPGAGANLDQRRRACRGGAVLTHDADACHGASGAPLWTIGSKGYRALAAIHRGGEGDNNYAVCMTAAVLGQLKNWGWTG